MRFEVGGARGRGSAMGQVAIAGQALYGLLYSIQRGWASAIKAFSLLSSEWLSTPSRWTPPIKTRCISLKWYFLYITHRSLTPTPVPISLGTSPPILGFFRLPSTVFTLWRSQPLSSRPFPPCAHSQSLSCLSTTLPLPICPFPTVVPLCHSVPVSFPRWWLMAEGSSMEYRSVWDGWGTRSSGQSRRSQTKD